MKNFFYFFLFLFQTCFLYTAKAQTAPAIRWQKAIGGNADDVFAGYDTLYSSDNDLSAKVQILNNRGNYIVAGTTRSNDFEYDVTWHLKAGGPDIVVGELDTAQKWIWKKNYGGNNIDELLSIQPANDSGYILLGTTTSNSGDVSGNHGGMDIWVVRLGSRGEILWQKCFGGSGNDAASFIEKVNGDGYIFIGSSRSANGDVSNNNGSQDIWVVRLDNNGNIRWQKSYGGSSGDLGVTIKLKPGGGFYIGGLSASKDGLFSDNHSQTTMADMWVAELDNNGNLVRSRCLGGSEGEFLTDIEVATDGTLYVTGQTNSNNGDVSGNHSNASDAWVAKLTGNFDIIWQKCFGGSDRFRNNHEYFEDIEIMADGSLIAAGITESDDGDISYNRGKTDCWIAKISKNGVLIWSKTYGGSGVDIATNITALDDNEFIFSGIVNSNDFDVSGNHGMFDMWLVRLGKINFLNGEVFVDQNANGLKDVGEPLYPNINIHTVKTGADSIATISSIGRFSIVIDTGTYITKLYNYLPYYSVTPASHTTTNSTYFNRDSVLFALQPIANNNDLRVSAIPINPARPGFNADYNIHYENVGTVEFPVAVIQFVKDSRLNVIGAEPMYDAINGDTLIWNFYNFQPLDKSNITIHFSISAPPVTNVGDSLHSNVTIFPAENDLTPNDDYANIVQLVVGSFDPNDKTEMHGGLFKIKEPSNSEYLNYMIRFQNTGTDTAFNVTIRDTLSSMLDWNSLEMTGASHGYQLNISKGNICTWKFANILLPDSNRNEPGSHGYIAFKIKPIGGIANGSKVNNKADIYFDYNLPVTTNLSSTLVKKMTPEMPALKNYQATYCVPGGPQKIQITNLPSSEYSATVEVKLDGTTLTVAADSSITLSPSTLQKGAHVITVSYSNVLATTTGTFNFSVNATAAPDVNVSANSSSVVNLTDPLIVMATNIAAGGSAPQFTFAHDRLFSSVIQAESINSTVSLYARDLTVGENMIYVRMKSNDPCSSSVYDIDSIKINRSSVTGVTDIDFPNQLINVYPNPFDKVVNIDGLNISKKYVLYIRNYAGQSLYAKIIQGRNDFKIEELKLSTGTYWLSIYDEKKKRLIGTIPILKK